MAGRQRGPGDPSRGGPEQAPAAAGAAEQIAAALGNADFDPQQAGDLFLRSDAEKAIRAALGAGAQVAVAGRDEARVRPVSFMGARFAPHLVVELGGGGRVAVTITLLRNDAGAIPTALANALVLSGSGRYGAVVAFILDRRLAKRDPFAAIEEPAQEASQARDLTDAERAFLDQLWERHRVRVAIRKQDPFGWG